MITGATLVAAAMIVGPFWHEAQRPTHGTWQEPDAPTDLTAAIADIFSQQCLTVVEAQAEIRANLLGLGYDDWTVTTGPGVLPHACVTASIVADDRRIRLLEAVRPDLREALDRARRELLQTCVGKDEAAARISSVLQTLGEVTFEVRTDGPIGGPTDEMDQITRHVDAGCSIYSGMGWTEEGVRVYFVGGR